jgi:hypothetical protein
MVSTAIVLRTGLAFSSATPLDFIHIWPGTCTYLPTEPNDECRIDFSSRPFGPPRHPGVTFEKSSNVPNQRRTQEKKDQMCEIVRDARITICICVPRPASTNRQKKNITSKDIYRSGYQTNCDRAKWGNKNPTKKGKKADRSPTIPLIDLTCQSISLRPPPPATSTTSPSPILSYPSYPST